MAANNQNIHNYDYLFKILLRGHDGAGKTSFQRRYIDNFFEEDFQPTLLVDFKVKNIQSTDTSKLIRLQIWDCAHNQDRFRAITNAYYRGAHGIVVLFDCTDRDSFKQASVLFKEIDRFSMDITQKILVATKIDLSNQRQVSYDEAKKLANELGVPYIETSAKNDTNINEAINILARNIERVVERHPPPPPLPPLKPLPAPGSWSCTVL